MDTNIDLDAYFARIGWGGPTTPTAATLAGLLRGHMRHIPFENLDVLLHRPVRLDLDHLQRKLVHERRGGYCFEQVTLFAAVLRALGMQPCAHTARVVIVLPRHASPRTHMLLTVPLREGTFIVDPGFGGLAPKELLPLADGARTPDGSHELARDGASWVLRALTDDAPADCWVTPLDADNAVDFEVGNHYTATHPQSGFVNRLMLRALTDDGHVSVMNRDVSWWRDGRRERTAQLADRAALRELLAGTFGFDLPAVETLRVPMIPEWN